MIENVNEEKLKELFEEIVPIGSSIGVHGIAKGDLSEGIASSILKTGLRNSEYHPGLTGTIFFLGQDEIVDYNEVLHYTYSSPDSKGNTFTIVCAIPDTLDTSDGKKYYIGRYKKFEHYGKDDSDALGQPTHNLKVLPKEYILGCIVRDTVNDTRKFIINENYITLKNEEEQRLINDDLLNKIFELYGQNGIYTFDEQGYKKVLLVTGVLQSTDDYDLSFRNRYESLTRDINSLK